MNDDELTVFVMYNVLGPVTGVGGLLLFGFAVSWWGALGIFLMLFGNNIQIHYQQSRAIKRAANDVVAFMSSTLHNAWSKAKTERDRAKRMRDGDE